MKRSASLIAWVLLATAAFVLWPERWGGSMSYVITSGTSMEPRFTAGDLAVLRAADDYRVGDVVGYRSPELGRLVLHRVVEERPDGLVFQGDNNDFLDAEVLPERQVAGRLLVGVPGFGPAAQWLLEPVHLAVGVVALWLLFGERAPTSPRSADPVRVPVRRMAVPDGALVAELADEGDLERLARAHGRPLLVDSASGFTAVYDGTVLHRVRTAEPVVVPLPRRAAGDWALRVSA